MGESVGSVVGLALGDSVSKAVGSLVGALLGDCVGNVEERIKPKYIFTCDEEEKKGVLLIHPVTILFAVAVVIVIVIRSRAVQFAFRTRANQNIVSASRENGFHTNKHLEHFFALR